MAKVFILLIYMKLLKNRLKSLWVELYLNLQTRLN